MSESNAIQKAPDPRTTNVLVPTDTVLGRVSPLHVLRYTTVRVDASTETYPLQGGGLGLHKSAINRMATAAGVRIVCSKPMTDTKDPDYLLWYAKVELRLGGQEPITYEAHKEWRRGVGKDGNDLEHRLSKLETKTILRAIRGVMAVKTKYTKDELSKPFAVPHYDYVPDLENPAVAAAFSQGLAADIRGMFGPASDEATGAGTEEDPLVGDVVGEEECEPFGPEEAPEPEPDEDDEPRLSEAEAQRLRELGGYLLEGINGPHNGRTLAEVWMDSPAWFPQVIQWSRNNKLTPHQEEILDRVQGFYGLVNRNEGRLP